MERQCLRSEGISDIGNEIDTIVKNLANACIVRVSRKGMNNRIQLFCVACANEPGPTNFQQTVVNGVPARIYQNYAEGFYGDPTPIWGIRDGRADVYGDKTRTGDIFLFYSGENETVRRREYGYLATVEGTERLPDISDEIWTRRDAEYDSETEGPEWPFIIFLSNVREVRIPSAELHDDIGWQNDYLQDFRRVKPEDVERIIGSGTVLGYLRGLATVDLDVEPSPRKTTDSTRVKSGTDSDGSSTATDYEERVRDLEPPERVRTEVSRTVRNTALVKQLKREYEYRCQVCGVQRKRDSDSYYAEGHHLHPLGDSPPGPDHEKNIIILCPNHHADFDYGMIKVDPDTFELSHAYESLSSPVLEVSDGHSLGVEYIEYHNRNIAQL